MKHISAGNHRARCNAPLQSNNRGATIIEMLVYTFLFGLIFTGIYLIFNASVKYYYVTQSNVWVQHSSMNAINDLSRELAESDLSSVVLYSSTPKGIVFMSPRTSSGAISYNSTSGYEGQPYWQKYICYYMYTDPLDSSKNVIFRKEKAVTPASAPSASVTYTTTYFATGGGSTLSHKIMTATNVTDFDIYWLNGSTKTYGTPTLNPIYISITAQENAYGNSNTITTTSSMEALN